MCEFTEYINAPIITCSDAEGAGEMFQVTTLSLEKIAEIGVKAGNAGKKAESASSLVDYSKDFFNKKTRAGLEKGNSVPGHPVRTRGYDETEWRRDGINRGLHSRYHLYLGAIPHLYKGACRFPYGPFFLKITGTFPTQKNTTRQNFPGCLHYNNHRGRQVLPEGQRPAG